MLKLSLIIPVYNEEFHIENCLKAVEAQTVMPDEVIIVDNNCTDRTIELAKQFNFVKVIKEPKQGRGHARAAGFSAAKYEIIGRIDADSVISPNWVERVKHNFSEDPDLAGVTGLGYTDYLPYLRFKSKIMSRAYYWFVHAGFNTVTMWGANMALRAEYWKKVADKVYDNQLDVHEDQDVSLWIAGLGGKNIVDSKLLITTSGQTFRYLPKTISYTFMFLKTKKLHKQNGNLSSKQLHKLGFFNTLPGRIGAFFVSIYGFFFALIFFPIDYVVIHSKYKNLLN
jgi:glycosyltransferase involved in cell wall biosynthesis